MKYNHKIALKNTPHFFGGLECVGHFFAYVAHFVLLRDVWVRIQRAAVSSSRAWSPIANDMNFACKKTEIFIIYVFEYPFYSF
jgi:hypothetical protein